MVDIDQTFIQPIENRSKPSITEAEGIPTIDLSPICSFDHLSDNINLNDHDISCVIKEIGDACEKWGFFQVINHGIPLKKLEKIEFVARKFFSLPLEEKKKVRKVEAKPYPMGYHDTEFTKNFRDWKEVFDFTTKHGLVSPNDLQVWPQNPPEFREVVEDYAKEVEKLAFKLMEVIALSLGLPANRFYDLFKDQTTSFVRLNYYPPCPSPHLALGVGCHKDADGLTILAQDDVEGLEVRRKLDGEWVLVKPSPGALIVNVGDTIQVWSNDKYESVEHRVKVNLEKDRISVPYFFNPAHYVMVKPLEELVSDENPPRYQEFNWGEYFVTRKKSSSKNLQVDNLQISHLKIT